jgi:hypothetical protein
MTTLPKRSVTQPPRHFPTCDTAMDGQEMAVGSTSDNTSPAAGVITSDCVMRHADRSIGNVSPRDRIAWMRAQAVAIR